MRLSMMVASAIMLMLSAAPSAAEAAMGSARADAVVIVNSASPGYPDFQHFIQPYLDHFGIPYTVLDIGASPVTAAIGDYALVVIGHRQLDLTHAYLDTTEEGFISAAVNSGAGLVNFDNALSGDGVSPRYRSSMMSSASATVGRSAARA